MADQYPEVVPYYWHKGDVGLNPGDLILPGRWGRLIEHYAEAHPLFHRERELENWRQSHTRVQVSRLSCTYAFEDRAEAEQFRTTVKNYHPEQVYAVEPIGRFPCHRADALWLTWMTEQGKTAEDIYYYYQAYWAGRSTTDLADYATSQWEWLFSTPLRVLERASVDRTRSH